MNIKSLLFIALISYGAYQSWQSRSVQFSASTQVASVPQQTNTHAKPFLFNGFEVTPLADFSLQALVLSRKDYHMGRQSDLSPVDLALGWGQMSEANVLKAITISQSNRFYFWRVDTFPIPREHIERQSANMHLVPANTAIESAIKSVRQGQVVQLSGYLIEAKATDGWRWKSSLTRNDTGNGACELVYVTAFSVQ